MDKLKKKKKIRRIRISEISLEDKNKATYKLQISDPIGEDRARGNYLFKSLVAISMNDRLSGTKIANRTRDGKSAKDKWIITEYKLALSLSLLYIDVDA